MFVSFIVLLCKCVLVCVMFDCVCLCVCWLCCVGNLVFDYVVVFVFFCCLYLMCVCLCVVVVVCVVGMSYIDPLSFSVSSVCSCLFVVF